MRPFDPSSLTPAQVATLRRASASGASLVADAFARLTGWPLELSAHRVGALRIDEVAGVMGGAETEMVGLHMGIEGGAGGDVLIALCPGSAGRLIETLHPAGPPLRSLEALTEMETSTLREVGNILGGAYLSAVSDRMKGALLVSVPSLAIDMAGALVDDLLARTARGAESALLIQMEISSRRHGAWAHLLHLPDPTTLPEMLAALASQAATGRAGE